VERSLGLFTPAVIAVLIASFLPLSCSEPYRRKGDRDEDEAGASGAPACTPGEALCECDTGNTCVGDLVCRDGRCSPEDPGSGGGGGSAGSADPAGSSGSGNPDGGTGTGGSVSPSGGSGNNTSGDGGTSDPSGGTGGSVAGSGALGGSEASGGSGATGGSGAEGGSAATGGTANGGSGGSLPGGPNLIVNGDFAADAYGWQFTDDVNAVAGYSNGEYCVTFGSGTGYGVIGYPAVGTLALEGGQTYEFSFSAWTDIADTMYLRAKVGDAEPPYADYGLAAIAQTPTKTSFSVLFSIVTGDPTAGVAFVFQNYYAAGQFCVDDVTVRAVEVSAQRH
jgi:hypothetical protein